MPITDPASFVGLYAYPLSCDDLQGNILDSLEEYWQQRSVVPGRRLLAVQLEDSEDLCRHVSGDGYVLLTRDHRDDHLGEPRLEVICLRLVHPARKMRALPGKVSSWPGGARKCMKIRSRCPAGW